MKMIDCSSHGSEYYRYKLSNPLQCLETQGEDLSSLWICSVTLLHLNIAGVELSSPFLMQKFVVRDNGGARFEMNNARL